MDRHDTSDFTKKAKHPGLKRMMRERGPFDLAVVMAGTNDISYGEKAEDIMENLRKLFAVMREGGTGRVLSVGIPDNAMVLRNPEADSRRLAANEALRELAAGDPGFVRFGVINEEVLDEASNNMCILFKSISLTRSHVFRYVDCPVGMTKGDAYEPDDLHFTPRTYDRFAERLLPTVKEMLDASS